MVMLQNNNISHIILIGNRYVEKYFQMMYFSRVWTDLFKYTQKEESVNDCSAMEIYRLIVNTGSVWMEDGVEPWVPWPKAAQHKLFPPSLCDSHAIHRCPYTRSNQIFQSFCHQDFLKIRGYSIILCSQKISRKNYEDSFLYQ